MEHRFIAQQCPPRLFGVASFYSSSHASCRIISLSLFLWTFSLLGKRTLARAGRVQVGAFSLKQWDAPEVGAPVLGGGLPLVQVVCTPSSFVDVGTGAVRTSLGTPGSTTRPGSSQGGKGLLTYNRACKMLALGAIS